jgi:hypothetical protein
MSGSPTFAEIRMRQEEERRLAEERRRRAEEERRRREEAERRARLALIAHLRESLDNEVANLEAELAVARADVHGSGSGFNLPVVEPQVQAARAAENIPEALSAALGRVRALSASVSALRGHLARQAEALEAEQAVLRREAEEEAQRLAAAASSKQAERQSKSLKAVGDLRVRIEGIEADVVTMAWSRPEVEAVKHQAASVERADEPEEVAAELHARLDGALEQAQERQLAEEKRAYIVAALQDGLRQQGFQVGDAVMVGDTDQGEVAFRAVRADRRWVDVNVPLQGHVFYEVDGTDRITERGTDGLVYTSCDETEARLESLHADLAERFGIKAGELFWESKDPNRESRNANALPSGGPSATRKQG